MVLPDREYGISENNNIAGLPSLSKKPIIVKAFEKQPLSRRSPNVSIDVEGTHKATRKTFNNTSSMLNLQNTIHSKKEMAVNFGMPYNIQDGRNQLGKSQSSKRLECSTKLPKIVLPLGSPAQSFEYSGLASVKLDSDRDTGVSPREAEQTRVVFQPTLSSRLSTMPTLFSPIHKSIDFAHKMPTQSDQNSLYNRYIEQINKSKDLREKGLLLKLNLKLKNEKLVSTLTSPTGKLLLAKERSINSKVDQNYRVIDPLNLDIKVSIKDRTVKCSQGPVITACTGSADQGSGQDSKHCPFPITRVGTDKFPYGPHHSYTNSEENLPIISVRQSTELDAIRAKFSFLEA